MGDIYAVSIYDNLYKTDNKGELLVTYSKIHADPKLKEIFNKYGGAEDARAIMTAECWLTTKEAADTFDDNTHINSHHVGMDILCAVNAMLHISNAYTMC